MFVDYYNILGVGFPASAEEIKAAYRSLSKKWHPDLNPGMDATDRMQQINDAYYILGNPARRERYNAEYLKYRQQQTYTETSSHTHSEPKTGYEDYNFSDEQVKSDMQNARKKAKEYVDEFMKELKKNNRKAFKEGSDVFVTYTLAGLFVSLITFLFSHC